MKHIHAHRPTFIHHFLTALAFLMAWFVLFALVFAAYMRVMYSPSFLVTLYQNIGSIISFYVGVGALLVLFSVWFTSRFYREEK